jgi:hypothetical protein
LPGLSREGLEEHPYSTASPAFGCVGIGQKVSLGEESFVVKQVHSWTYREPGPITQEESAKAKVGVCQLEWKVGVEAPCVFQEGSREEPRSCRNRSDRCIFCEARLSVQDASPTGYRQRA